MSIYWIIRLFHEIPVRVRFMDPDGAGGFGFIGNYLLRLTLLIIAIGYGISIDFFIMPLIQGRPIYLGPDVILAWGLYVFMVPMRDPTFIKRASSITGMTENMRNSLKNMLITAP